MMIGALQTFTNKEDDARHNPNHALNHLDSSSRSRSEYKTYGAGVREQHFSKKERDEYESFDSERAAAMRTLSKQRVIISSQALEINRMQDFVREQEIEQHDRNRRHIAHIEELESSLQTVVARGEKLEEENRVLRAKLGHVESQLEIMVAKEKSASVFTNEDNQPRPCPSCGFSGVTNRKQSLGNEKCVDLPESDRATLMTMKQEITKLRLEHRTLAEEKSVLLQKLLDERAAADGLKKDRSDLTKANHQLEQRVEELMLEVEELRRREADEVNATNTPHRTRRRIVTNNTGHQRGAADVFVSSTSSQTSTEPIVPFSALAAAQRSLEEAYALSFSNVSVTPQEAEEKGKKRGSQNPLDYLDDDQDHRVMQNVIGTDPHVNPIIVANTLTEDLKYLLVIEKERLAFYRRCASEHEENVRVLNDSLKSHVTNQMRRLGEQQRALQNLMREATADDSLGDIDTRSHVFVTGPSNPSARIDVTKGEKHEQEKQNNNNNNNNNNKSTANSTATGHNAVSRRSVSAAQSYASSRDSRSRDDGNDDYMHDSATSTHEDGRGRTAMRGGVDENTGGISKSRENSHFQSHQRQQHQDPRQPETLSESKSRRLREDEKEEEGQEKRNRNSYMYHDRLDDSSFYAEDRTPQQAGRAPSYQMKAMPKTASSSALLGEEKSQRSAYASLDRPNHTSDDRHTHISDSKKSSKVENNGKEGGVGRRDWERESANLGRRGPEHEREMTNLKARLESLQRAHQATMRPPSSSASASGTHFGASQSEQEQGRRSQEARPSSLSPSPPASSIRYNYNYNAGGARAANKSSITRSVEIEAASFRRADDGVRKQSKSLYRDADDDAENDDDVNDFRYYGHY